MIVGTKPLDCQKRWHLASNLIPTRLAEVHPWPQLEARSCTSFILDDDLGFPQLTSIAIFQCVLMGRDTLGVSSFAPDTVCPVLPHSCRIESSLLADESQLRLRPRQLEIPHIERREKGTVFGAAMGEDILTCQLGAPRTGHMQFLWPRVPVSDAAPYITLEPAKPVPAFSRCSAL